MTPKSLSLQALARFVAIAAGFVSGCATSPARDFDPGAEAPRSLVTERTDQDSRQFNDLVEAVRSGERRMDLAQPSAGKATRHHRALLVRSETAAQLPNNPLNGKIDIRKFEGTIGELMWTVVDPKVAKQGFGFSLGGVTGRDRTGDRLRITLHEGATIRDAVLEMANKANVNVTILHMTKSGRPRVGLHLE
jgi:hypothetical protein